MAAPFIHVLSTGGTIDKVYFDALSEYHVGDSPADEIFRGAGVTFTYAVESLLKKDSLELTDEDRELIRTKIVNSNAQYILLTHGTDTMTKTAEALQTIEGKTIVLTGAMQPACMRVTDAHFNIGFAVAALQTLPAGVYIAMSGQVFEAGSVRKNRAQGRFESIER